MLTMLPCSHLHTKPIYAPTPISPQEAKQRAEAQAAEERRRREEEERAKEAQRLAEEAERMKPDDKELLKVAGSGPAGFGGEGAEEVSQQLIHLVKERHTPLDCLDSVGRTPLLVAAGTGCLEAVATLIDLGSDTSALSVDKVDALGYAVKGNHDLVTRYLMGQSVEGAPAQLSEDKLPSVTRIHASIVLTTDEENDTSLKVLCVCGVRVYRCGVSVWTCVCLVFVFPLSKSRVCYFC